MQMNNLSKWGFLMDFTLLAVHITGQDCLNNCYYRFYTFHFYDTDLIPY